jgi:uncharacterized iron-regulated protein
VCLPRNAHLHNEPVITSNPHSAQAPIDHARRRVVTAGLGWLALQGLVGCAATVRRPYAWEERLQGSTVALLGEVHDNAEHHRLRAAILRRAFEAGWRPALVMEQFDLDRQADIERGRGERPRDAGHLIAQAGASKGWRWPDYEPLVALALEFDLPLLAGNLPRAQAVRVMRDGHEAVFGAERTRELGLDRKPDAAWQAAQEHEIDTGHCGALPRSVWAGMARAQFARDAVMAQLLRQHAARGAVLLAGNGHVRRDIGVPRWMPGDAPESLLAVGFVEFESAPIAVDQFDAVVITARAWRADPCEAFKARPARPGIQASVSEDDRHVRNAG